MEKFIAEEFPNDVATWPGIVEMERHAALAMQFGHPLLQDGHRPISPNYIMVKQ